MATLGDLKAFHVPEVAPEDEEEEADSDEQMDEEDGSGEEEGAKHVTADEEEDDEDEDEDESEVEDVKPVAQQSTKQVEVAPKAGPSSQPAGPVSRSGMVSEELLRSWGL